MQLSSVEKAGGRQEPRHREAGGRKHGTTMAPAHHGRAALGQASGSLSNPLQFPPAANSGLPKRRRAVATPPPRSDVTRRMGWGHARPVSPATNTTTMVNISTHLLSVDLRLLEFRIQSQLCELTIDARSVRWTCVHAAIANIFALMDGVKMPSGFAVCFKSGLRSSHNPHHKYRQLSVRHRAVEMDDRSGVFRIVPFGQTPLVKTSVILQVSDLPKLHTQQILMCLKKSRQWL